MAFIIKDRVKEGTVTTGTGAFALGGAASTFEAFNSYMSNGDTAYYAVVHTASGVDEWEVGLGTFNTGNTLTRTTILSSSNSGNAVSFSSGTKDIFMTYPADRAVIEEPDRSVAFPAGISVTGNVAASGTIDGRDVAADGTKLDGIETAATADQTASEIRTLVESASDSNVFTDADHTKLNAIEAGATADQTAAEIKTLVGSATDSNVFTDADHTKLDGIETAATADQTKADIEGLGIDVPATNLTGTIPAARLSTATTQAESDDSTKIATTAYVVDKITTLIGGAPSTLNDLNELAAAINDDANYNSTLTTALATKLPLAGGALTGAVTTNSTFDGRNVSVDGSKLDGIEANATADQTAAQILTALKTVDGSGSGLDADLIDGLSSDAFIRSNAADVKSSGDLNFSDSVKATFGASSDLQIYHDGSNNHSFIKETGTGSLKVLAQDFAVNNPADTANMITAAVGGAVTAFHNGGVKLATTATGIDVTGTVTADGINSSGDFAFTAADGMKISAKESVVINIDSDDNDSSRSFSVTSGSPTSLEYLITATEDAGVNLYHNNASKLSTSSTGIDVTGNVVVSGTVDGRDVATDGTKLDGIEANAKNDQTITAGSGLSGGGTGDVTLSHADTSSVSNSDNSGNTFIQDITFDTYGHVQSVGTGTVSVGNGTLTVQGTGALGGSGTFTANQSGNATISISHDDTSSQASVNGSGRTYIQDVTLDTYGHVTGLATATETVTDTTYSVGDGGLTQKNFTTTLKSKLDGIASGAQVNVPTNLGSGTSTTDVTIVSSSGSNTTVPGATTSAAGVISAADKAKLDGVATGATANVGDITGVTAGTNLNGGGSSGGVTVNLDANITLTTVTATNFNTTSDRNTKKDITPIADAVRKVQQLGGYNFTFKDTDEKSSGVIAQEVQEVLPELVQEGDEGHLTVQYGNMVGLLIEAIKEQQTQIDELKQKLNS